MTACGAGLAGWRVLVTASDAGRVCRALEARGALPLPIPTIKTRSLPGDPLDAALRRAASYDWIVVTSPNGAASVLGSFGALGLVPPAGPRWAAVGPATRAALERGGVEVAFVPDDPQGVAIPDGLGNLRGKRALLLRSRTAGRDLPRGLRRRGAEVDDVAAYETAEGPESSRGALEAALARGLDAAIFTSGSTVRGFLRLAGGSERALDGAVIVAIGPATARAVEEASLGPARVAVQRTTAGLLAALEAAALEGAAIQKEKHARA
ncbi:hypothetical protein BH18GEM1_BH18GEM1_02210 [soil metagenome]